jgi:XTP/dITP diphosphohydrolase
LEDIGCYEEILETADTIGNSVLKANYVNRKADCFADDTGLSRSSERRSWVFSARYAGEQRMLTTWIKLQVLSNQQSKCPIQNGSSSILMENNTYLPE